VAVPCKTAKLTDVSFEAVTFGGQMKNVLDRGHNPPTEREGVWGMLEGERIQCGGRQITFAACYTNLAHLFL